MPTGVVLTSPCACSDRRTRIASGLGPAGAESRLSGSPRGWQPSRGSSIEDHQSAGAQAQAEHGPPPFRPAGAEQQRLARAARRASAAESSRQSPSNRCCGPIRLPCAEDDGIDRADRRGLGREPRRDGGAMLLLEGMGDVEPGEAESLARRSAAPASASSSRRKLVEVEQPVGIARPSRAPSASCIRGVRDSPMPRPISAGAKAGERAAPRRQRRDAVRARVLRCDAAQALSRVLRRQPALLSSDRSRYSVIARSIGTWTDQFV